MDISRLTDNLRKSFAEVKNDIEMLKQEVATINNKLDLKKPIKKQDPDKIFTSKVFINQDIINAVIDVFNSGVFVLGEKTKEFEKKFSDFTGAKYAIAIANGTVAIEVALQCLKIKEGDEIIVPSHTTMPTIEPILKLKAKPIFVDIDPKTYLIDTNLIESAITKKTKAIIPVHIYGNPANMSKIKQICDKHEIYLIEDCAQAHGAKHKEKCAGTFGDVGCFSFYPTKNLTVCGEGGMLITNNPEINETARMLISHGEKIGERYNHVILGNNYRLSEIHSAIGIKQLELLDYFTKRRREIAEKYNKLLKGFPIILPYEDKDSYHVYHLYVIRVKKEKRDMIIQEMKKNNIFLGIHYPTPCHLQKVVTDRFKTPKLKITEQIREEIISLPIYPELKDEEIELICNKLKPLIA